LWIVSPPTRRNACSSMPPSCPRTRRRQSGSSISIMNVATSSAPFGTSGLYAASSSGTRAALLDVDHLLHLQPHRVVRLEIECRVRPHFDAAGAFQRADPLAVLGAVP